MSLTEDDWADLALAAHERMPDADVAVVLMADGHNVGCHTFPGEVLTDEDTATRLLVGLVCHLATANGVSPLRISIGITSILEQLVAAGRVVTTRNGAGQLVTGVVGPNGESSAGADGLGLGVVEGGRSAAVDADGSDPHDADRVRSAPSFRPTLRVVRPDGDSEGDA